MCEQHFIDDSDENVWGRAMEYDKVICLLWSW